MKVFFRIISGMGFVTTLIGMGAMDSTQLTLPITMVFAGIGAYVLGTKMEDGYVG